MYFRRSWKVMTNTGQKHLFCCRISKVFGTVAPRAKNREREFLRLDDKLKKLGHEQLWQEYCGFVDMSLSEYMYTQRRLLEEQLTMWCNSGLGRQMLRGAQPRSIEELRAVLPLTSYAD